MTALIGDQIYLLGLKENELAYFKLSKRIFPFDKEIITGQALTLIRNRIINEQVYFALKDALKYDPYSVEMLGMYIQYANMTRNKNEASMSFKKLQKIAPNSNVLKELEKLNYKEILKGF